MAYELAVEARKLKLSALNVADCPEEVVRAFAQIVLDELAARGLLAGAVDLGCWAGPRPQGH